MTKRIAPLPFDGATIDTFEFTRCCEFRYVDDGGEQSSTSIEMRLVSDDDAELSLRLTGVQSFRLPGDCGPHFWLSEFEVLDVKDRGLERIGVLATSDNGLACYCATVEWLGYTPPRR